MKNSLTIQGFQSKIIIFYFLILTISVHSLDFFPSSYKSFLDDCDACSCSSVGGSLGMGGVLDTNFVGLRYLHQVYKSKNGIFKDSPRIDEYFNTIQIWSRIPIYQKLELQVFIPYHSHQRKYTDRNEHISGLGDFIILSNYTILDEKLGGYNKETDKISMKNHLLKIGLGIKLPTGKYNQKINNSVNPSFQLGTGSFDYISSLLYVFKFNRFGVKSNINYIFKNENSEDYKFGSQFNINTTFFYIYKDDKKNVFVPSFSFLGEFFGSNKHFGLEIENSRGYDFLSSIGLEYNRKKITFGLSGSLPIIQNLAKQAIQISYRASLYFNYNF